MTFASAFKTLNIRPAATLKERLVSLSEAVESSPGQRNRPLLHRQLVLSYSLFAKLELMNHLLRLQDILSTYSTLKGDL